MSESIEYTEAQATDEALLLFVRKMRRLAPEAYTEVMGHQLPEGAPWAIERAQQRAENLRAADQRAGVTRTYPNPFLDEAEAEGDESTEPAPLSADAEAIAFSRAHGCMYHKDGFDGVIREQCAVAGSWYRVEGDVWCGPALVHFQHSMGKLFDVGSVVKISG